MSSLCFRYSVDDILCDIAAGKMCIVVDSLERENEGDLIISGKFANHESINFMMQKAHGIICVAIDDNRANKLGLDLLPQRNAGKNMANFTIPVDAIEKYGVTSGISAYDRAITIQVIVNDNSTNEDLSCPGHVFPLIANKDGLTGRQGHTEASVELMKMAGLPEVAVICELIADDGSVMNTDSLILFSEKYNIKIISVDEILCFIKNRSKI